MAYIYAYAPDEDDCSTIGLVGALLDEDAEFNLKAGEFGELTFTHPVDPYGKWKALVNGAILKTMVPMRLCPGLKEDGTYVAAVDRYAVSATATKAQRYLYSGSGLSGSGKKKALLKVGQVATVTGVADASDNNSRYKVKLGKVSGWMERAGLTLTQQNVPVEQDEGGLESAEPSYAVRQQLFRIYEVNPQTSDSDPGSIEVHARRIVYDLLGNLSTYKDNGSLTCRAACENVLRSAVMPHDFAIFTDIGDSHVGFDAMNVNPIAALIDPEDGVAARWGAEIVCDDYEIYVLRRAGLDRGVRIEYAKNLIGVDVREDVSGVATAIRPAGEDKSGNPLYIGGSVVDGRHVYNGGTALPDGLRFYTAPDGAVNGAIVVRDGYDSDSPPRIHFEAVGDARVGKGSGDVTVAIARQMLVERAAALFDGGCDVPEIRMRVDFVMLGDTAEYAQYKHLEPLFVYDTVHIHDRRVGVRADIDLTELTWLVRPERVSAAEFGALKDMTASISGWQISSVSGAKILPGTVGAGQIGDDTISARAIQADSVNADAMQANSVTAGKVAAGAITAEKLSAGAVTADKLAANAVTAAKIDANSVSAAVVETDAFEAATADIARAEIGSADIGFAQIKDANVEQLIARDAVTGRYYIRKLQVDNAQMVQATVGALVIRAGDGKYYRLDFDSSGNLTPTEVTLTQGEIAAGETADGRGSIIETDLTVQDLAAANMKAINALIDKITTKRLYATQAFIDELHTSMITDDDFVNVVVGVGNAQSAASAAQATADGAASAASTAQSTANGAASAANAAQSAANGAASAAAAAQSTADSAASAASAAQATADAKADPMTATAHGGEIAVSDSAEAAIGGLVIYGRSTQNGTPSPTAPALIYNAGAFTAKNMLPGLASETTIDGVKYTPQADGTVKAVGTSSGQHPLYLMQNVPWAAGNYLLSGGSGLSGTGVRITAYVHGNGRSTYYDVTSSDPKTIVVGSGEQLDVYFRSNGGSVAINATLYPMLRYASVADDAFEPYDSRYPVGVPVGTQIALTLSGGSGADQTVALPTPNGLPGIAVSSGGNYTDENDQQWVCDTIDLAAGTYTRRCGMTTFGALTWESTTHSVYGTYFRAAVTGLGILREGAFPTTAHHALTSHYPVVARGSLADKLAVLDGTTTQVTQLQVKDSTYSTADSFKAAMPDVPFVYLLATPVVTPLTEAQLTALRSIRTRDGTTVLTNDAGADMDLTYATQTGGGSYVEGVRQGLDDDVNRAQNAADAAQVTADAAREDFRRVVRIDTEGLHVGDSQTSNEVMIDSESVNVVLGGRKYSKFAGDYVQFGDYQLRRSVDGGLVFKKA